MPKFYNVGQTRALQSLVWPDLFPTLTAGMRMRRGYPNPLEMGM